MLILGVALGLILGLVAGGKIENLVYVRLRWIALLFLAAAVRFGTEFLLVQGNDLVEQFRLPLFTSAYTLLLVALYMNRRQPGIPMAFVGILGNAIAIVGNGGYMPVWQPSLIAAGFQPDQTFSPLHTIVPAPLNAAFLSQFGFLGDIIPIPLPIVQNVASIGDIFLAAGLAFFLFATVVRGPEELKTAIATPTDDRIQRALGGIGVPQLTDGSAAMTAVVTPGTGLGRDIRHETGVTPALAGAAALERSIVLGGSSAGLSGSGISSIPLGLETAAERARRRALVPTLIERARRHPYVRLALNGSFSALWLGQLISLFGDRMHQLALAFLVLTATQSPLAVGLVFLAATLPNLLLGPIAGTFVDRWDQKEVMVVSDLLRAAIILVVPIAAVTNLLLIYPLVFLITSISIFFRPARTAVIPRIVAEDELLTANSATWIAETLADVVGYPLAGLFVAFLGPALPLAFWFDAATYIASALLIATMAVPAISSVKRPTVKKGTAAGGERLADADAEAAEMAAAHEASIESAAAATSRNEEAADRPTDGLADQPARRSAALRDRHAAALRSRRGASKLGPVMADAADTADPLTYPIADRHADRLLRGPYDVPTDETSWVAAEATPPNVAAADMVDEPALDAEPPTRPGVGGFVDELTTGWRFLRGETVLLANTLQAAVGQFTIGVLLTLTPFYARDIVERGQFDATADGLIAYAFLETGIGLGNLIGGFLIGLIGARLAKGRMVIAGYALWGLFTLGLAVTGNLGLALGMMFGSGVANMIYIIPSQTMFQERTPPNLIGRVVGFRFALVFGSMTLAMGISGILAAQFGVPAVIGFFGLMTLGAGLSGLLVPAVRNA